MGSAREVTKLPSSANGGHRGDGVLTAATAHSLQRVAAPLGPTTAALPSMPVTNRVTSSSDARPHDPRPVLRLYIAGGAPSSTIAESNLASLLESNGVTDYDLEIIDCLKNPRRAIGDGVLVIPTLIRFAPLPLQTIVGTLSDAGRVGAALGFATASHGDRASA